MSRFSPPFLPEGTNPETAERYRTTYLQCQAELYDPASVVMVGALPEEAQESGLREDPNQDEWKQRVGQLRDVLRACQACDRTGRRYAVNLEEMRPIVERQTWGVWEEQNACLSQRVLVGRGFSIQGDIVTAVYLPALFRGFVCARSLSAVVVRPDPETLRERHESPEFAVEASCRFWERSMEEFRTAGTKGGFLPTGGARLPYCRSETFWIGTEEYVRWTPFHPYLPFSRPDQELELLLEDGVDTPARLFAETVYVAQNGCGLLKSDRSCVVRDDDTETKLWF